MIARLGLSPQIVNGAADVLTPLAGTFGYANTSGRPDDPTVAPITPSPYTSMPTSLITPAAVAKRRWTTTRAGWPLERSTPLTADQQRIARNLARSTGLTVEVRDQQPELGAIRAAATAFGTLLALGILALVAVLLEFRDPDNIALELFAPAN